MPLLPRILKFTPTVVLELLVVAWMAMEFGHSGYGTSVGRVLLLLFSIKAMTRFAERPFDIVVGLLAVSGVAVSFVILGMQMTQPHMRSEVDFSAALQSDLE